MRTAYTSLWWHPLLECVRAGYKGLLGDRSNGIMYGSWWWSENTWADSYSNRLNCGQHLDTVTADRLRSEWAVSFISYSRLSTLLRGGSTLRWRTQVRCADWSNGCSQEELKHAQLDSDLHAHTLTCHSRMDTCTSLLGDTLEWRTP